MEKDHKERIEYTKPELLDLDKGEEIAGSGSECQPGSYAPGYCGAGTSAGGSGCQSGGTVTCSTGHFVAN
jgi:hypothetical protein